MEDDLWWKMTFIGKQRLVEDDLWWKMTFGGRQPSVEDDPCMLPSLLCGIFVKRVDGGGRHQPYLVYFMLDYYYSSVGVGWYDNNQI